METGVSLQSTQGPLGPSWTQHIAEGASCVSTRSWLPLHKTKTPANALHPVRKKLDISEEPAGSVLDFDAKGPPTGGKACGYCRKRFRARNNTFAGRSANRRIR